MKSSGASPASPACRRRSSSWQQVPSPKDSRTSTGPTTNRWFALATLLTQSEEVARDLVQDVFARSYHRFEALEDPLPYLRRSVVNASRSWHRRRRLEWRHAAEDVPGPGLRGRRAVRRAGSPSRPPACRDHPPLLRADERRRDRRHPALPARHRGLAGPPRVCPSPNRHGRGEGGLMSDRPPSEFRDIGFGPVSSTVPAPCRRRPMRSGWPQWPPRPVATPGTGGGRPAHWPSSPRPWSAWR